MTSPHEYVPLEKVLQALHEARIGWGAGRQELFYSAMHSIWWNGTPCELLLARVCASDWAYSDEEWQSVIDQVREAYWATSEP